MSAKISAKANVVETETKSIVLVGVGGQGILLASEILAQAAMLEGYDVKTNEVHGMAQRGGSVMAQMTEEDLAAYVDGTILNGEFATLQGIPQIAQALQQAQAGLASYTANWSDLRVLGIY